jgi:hypothetical protein
MLAGVAIVTTRHLDPSSPFEFLPLLQPHLDYIKMTRQRKSLVAIPVPKTRKKRIPVKQRVFKEPLWMLF